MLQASLADFVNQQMAHMFVCQMKHLRTEAGPSEGVCAMWCRAAQQDAEAVAAEESQRLRRLAAQEALLKDTFLEAVEAEKERLLLARERERDRAVPGKPVHQARPFNPCVVLLFANQVLTRYMQTQSRVLQPKSVPILFYPFQILDSLRQCCQPQIVCTPSVVSAEF